MAEFSETTPSRGRPIPAPAFLSDRDLALAYVEAIEDRRPKVAEALNAEIVRRSSGRSQNGRR